MYYIGCYLIAVIISYVILDLEAKYFRYSYTYFLLYINGLNVDEEEVKKIKQGLEKISKKNPGLNEVDIEETRGITSHFTSNIRYLLVLVAILLGPLLLVSHIFYLLTRKV